jgi:hypothetical protein
MMMMMMMMMMMVMMLMYAVSQERYCVVVLEARSREATSISPVFILVTLSLLL